MMKNELTKNNKNESIPITDVEKYLEQLSENDKKIIKIAEEILESSFDIEKSIGFQEWKKI
jgi:hypothetical protein